MASERKPLAVFDSNAGDRVMGEFLHHLVFGSEPDRRTASNRIDAACSPSSEKRALCLAFENCPAAFWISLPISLAHE
jgi:hypothetical protein